ncbi:MAG: hypothetical protein R3E09_01925 [Novosphingobium sp.]
MAVAGQQPRGTAIETAPVDSSVLRRCGFQRATRSANREQAGAQAMPIQAARRRVLPVLGKVKPDIHSGLYKRAMVKAR